MPTSGESPHGPLHGATLYMFGRVHGLTRARIEKLAAAGGGKLTVRPNARVTMVALGHTAADNVLPDGDVRLPAGLPASAELVSEFELRRRLGLMRPPTEVARQHSIAEVARVSGLSEAQVACLALFDVIELVDGRIAYLDLVAAREAGRLARQGVEFRRIVEAALALKRRGNHLSDSRLAEGASGALLVQLAGRTAELDGQLTMSLSESPQSVDDVVAAAEAAEDEGDLASAEALYATALRADPGDPGLPFNLGNIFDAQGRAAEAKIAWQIAAARDPSFAEAWYNLGTAAEDAGQDELALAQYRRAAKARPDFEDAHFNLALLLTRRDRAAEALPVWDRFLALNPQGAQAATAKKAATLCRMHIREAQAKATG